MFCRQYSSISLLVVALIVGHFADTGFSTEPEYFNPWPVEEALGTGIPKAILGRCYVRHNRKMLCVVFVVTKSVLFIIYLMLMFFIFQAGTVYTIRSVDDLLKDIAKLECIYVAGAHACVSIM